MVGATLLCMARAGPPGHAPGSAWLRPPSRPTVTVGAHVAPAPASMLDRLIDFAVHKRAFALMLSLSFAIFGVWTFKRLKI